MGLVNISMNTIKRGYVSDNICSDYILDSVMLVTLTWSHWAK